MATDRTEIHGLPPFEFAPGDEEDGTDGHYLVDVEAAVVLCTLFQAFLNPHHEMSEAILLDAPLAMMGVLRQFDQGWDFDAPFTGPLDAWIQREGRRRG